VTLGLRAVTRRTLVGITDYANITSRDRRLFYALAEYRIVVLSAFEYASELDDVVLKNVPITF
jgi:hypothetical protein